MSISASRFRWRKPSRTNPRARCSAIKRPATVGVPDSEYDELTEEDVVEYLDGRVADHAVPSGVAFVESVPLTDIGKTDEKALRERDEPKPRQPNDSIPPTVDATDGHPSAATLPAGGKTPFAGRPLRRV